MIEFWDIALYLAMGLLVYGFVWTDVKGQEIATFAFWALVIGWPVILMVGAGISVRKWTRPQCSGDDK